MKKTLGALVMFWLSSMLKGLQANGGHMELTRLKMSVMYVRSIKTFRLLFMSLLGIGLSLMFLFIGLIVFHISLFLYAPWTMEIKMVVGLVFSAVYLLASLSLFSQIFAPEKWLEIFNANDIAKDFQQPQESPNAP